MKLNDNRHFVYDMVTVALPESLLAYPNIRCLISSPWKRSTRQSCRRTVAPLAWLLIQSSGVAMTEMENLMSETTKSIFSK